MEGRTEGPDEQPLTKEQQADITEFVRNCYGNSDVPEFDNEGNLIIANKPMPEDDFDRRRREVEEQDTVRPPKS